MIEAMPETSTNIAILDDDAHVRKALLRLLETLQYKASAYASAGEFLHTLDSNEPECMVVDMQMPAMTGLELLSHLRQIGRDIPIIIMTGFDQPNLREICLDAGASAYLLKPIDKHALVAAVDEAIGATE